jgi:hypothetical protein
MDYGRHSDKQEQGRSDCHVLKDLEARGEGATTSILVLSSCQRACFWLKNEKNCPLVHVQAAACEEMKESQNFSATCPSHGKAV